MQLVKKTTTEREPETRSPRISLRNVENKARDSYHTQEKENRKIERKKRNNPGCPEVPAHKLDKKVDEKIKRKENPDERQKQLQEVCWGGGWEG